MAKSKPAFAVGDRVAWHHAYAGQFPPGVIVYASAVPTHPDKDEPGGGQLGTVKGVANDEATYFDVLLDGEKQPRTLTAEELVQVSEPE